MYEHMMDVAFAGMKGDSGDDRVESWPVAEAGAGFGVVVSETDGAVAKGTGTRVVGVTVHSHAVTGDGYKQYDCASVMTRGLVWAKVSTNDAATAIGSEVKFDANGELDSTQANTLTNARVRDVRTVKGGKVALVELHAPTV